MSNDHSHPTGNKRYFDVVLALLMTLFALASVVPMPEG
jgi:hypothetical protein